MKAVLLFLFLLSFILRYMARSSTVVRKSNLFENDRERYKMGFRANELKKKMMNIENPEIRAELKTSIRYIQLSNFAFFALLLVFLIAIIYHRYDDSKELNRRLNKTLEFEEAAEILLLNYDSIHEILENKDEHLSSKTWNFTYFTNEILPYNKNLEDVVILWDNGIISKENGAIIMEQDSSIFFREYTKERMVYGIDYFFIFSKKWKNKKIEYPYELIKEEKIKSNWYYVVIKQFYDY